MTFDFNPDTWYDDGVVHRCQPDIMRSNGTITWIDGAAINGHQWGFYNDGVGTFIVYYVNDAGHEDQWLLTETDNPYSVRIPDPNNFEANVALALDILTDPAVREYNAALTPALPADPQDNADWHTGTRPVVDRDAHGHPTSDAGVREVFLDKNGNLILPDDDSFEPF